MKVFSIIVVLIVVCSCNSEIPTENNETAEVKNHLSDSDDSVIEPDSTQFYKLEYFDPTKEFEEISLDSLNISPDDTLHQLLGAWQLQNITEGYNISAIGNPDQKLLNNETMMWYLPDTTHYQFFGCYNSYEKFLLKKDSIIHLDGSSSFSWGINKIDAYTLVISHDYGNQEIKTYYYKKITGYNKV